MIQTSEEIDYIALARQAGYRFADDTDQRMANHGQWQRNLLEAFAKLVDAKATAREREAMLDLVDAYAKNNTDLADAIRARGATE